MALRVIHVISKKMKLKTKCSFLDKTQTICVSPVRNKENEFHRHHPIEVTADVGETIVKMLDKIQSEMFQKAKKLLDENVAQVES